MRRALLVWAALALSGCVSLPPKPVEIDATRLAGRLSVTVAGAQGRAAGGNASFELLGNPSTGRLELTSPLGTLVARASWQPGSVLLQTSDQERRFADLDELTRELLGEAIPVAALFDWLRGRPWAQAASQPLAGGAAGFEQLGWRIDLSRQAERALVATRLADPVVTLRARLEERDEVAP